LLKDAAALERLEDVDTLVVDKTGTLTEGKPKVTAVHAVDNFTESEVLRIAAAVARASEHPLSAAIAAAAQQAQLPLGAATQFHSHTGKGVSGEVEGKQILLGSSAYLREAGIEPLNPRLTTGAETLVDVAIAGKFAGWISLSDTIKSTAPAAVRELQKQGLRVVMLTGDSGHVAQHVAKLLRITDYKAKVLPQEKQSAIQALQQQGSVVAMAGDGINDAPALAQADVGIAMGTGTDVAMESGGITLVKGDLAGIVRARNLSRFTMRNIRQNLFFAFAYNVVGIPIAAGVLYPVFGLLLTPVLAAAAMSFSSVSVIANALRLRKANL